MAYLNRAILYCILHLQGWDDFAGSKDLDVELAIGCFAQRIGKNLGCAIQVIQ